MSKVCQCAYRDGCPMFKLFTLDSSKEFYKKRYCCSDNFVNCERYKLRTNGNKVPENMLPNGRTLNVF